MTEIRRTDEEFRIKKEKKRKKRLPGLNLKNKYYVKKCIFQRNKRLTKNAEIKKLRTENGSLERK